MRKMRLICVLSMVAAAGFRTDASYAASAPTHLTISRSDYLDRVRGIWTAQMIGQLTGLLFEHKTASVLKDTPLVRPDGFALPDDDYYYEIVAIRAFEKYGINLTVEQLGDQWVENNAGSYGSSEQALLLLKRGVKAPDSGNPRYNKLWWTIGPQFSSDVYGTLNPGMPNAAAMARRLGHINGYAEGTDGAVFVAGMISMGFVEKDTHEIVRKAASLIAPLSPYRQCLNTVISMAESGKPPEEIFRAIDERWGIEYPATNNAVLNGGIVATSVWFGNGDFRRTVNLAFQGVDFSDTDCNAANAGSVVGAMHGMSALPAQEVAAFHDRIRGDVMGPLKLTPPLDESISRLAERTAAVGEKILLSHGARVAGNNLVIPIERPKTLDPEIFKLADFMKIWNPGWKLERAGYGGAGGGIRGIRGNTHLEGETLAVFPRDEVRGALMRRSAPLTDVSSLSFDAGADEGRAWHLEVFIDNDKVLDRLIDGSAVPKEASSTRGWEHVSLDLSKYREQTVVIRLYDLILVPGP
jgi:hypothetical protein